jgi:hypothetical protein
MFKVTFVELLVFLKDKLLAVKAFQLFKVNNRKLVTEAKWDFMRQI